MTKHYAHNVTFSYLKYLTYDIDHLLLLVFLERTL